MSFTKQYLMSNGYFDQHGNWITDEPLPNEPVTVGAFDLSFSLLDSSKDERELFMQKLIARILDEGRLNPLDALIQLKVYAEIIERCTDKKKYPETALPFTRAAIEEANKYGSKSFQFHNAEIQVRDTGRNDFSFCEDPVWNDLMKQKKVIDFKLKEREKFLLGIAKGGQQILCGDEVVMVYPPIKKGGSETIFVTLK